jgi:PEP-CTERM motif-containing protein
MRRRVGCVSLVIALSFFTAVSKSAAVPLTVAYIDNATGVEWAQVADTTGFAWQDVAGVCATDGATACGANLDGVELTGWTWALVTQIADLMANSTDLTLAQLSPTASALDSTWAPQFLSIFMPTLITDSHRTVTGWAADGSAIDPRSAFSPEVVDAIIGMTDTAGRGSLFDSQPPFAPLGSDTRGLWLFRPVSAVPEPSTLLLLGVGGAGALHWRARRMKRS